MFPRAPIPSIKDRSCATTRLSTSPVTSFSRRRRHTIFDWDWSSGVCSSDLAAFKLLKACSLIALGVGALKLLHRDVAAVVEHWINMFQVDPRNHFINLLLTKLSNFDDRRQIGRASCRERG